LTFGQSIAPQGKPIPARKGGKNSGKVGKTAMREWVSVFFWGGGGECSIYAGQTFSRWL